MSQNHRPAAPAIDPTKKSSLFEAPLRVSDLNSLPVPFAFFEEEYVYSVLDRAIELILWVHSLHSRVYQSH
jgi:hypothetical protein